MMSDAQLTLQKFSNDLHIAEDTLKPLYKKFNKLYPISLNLIFISTGLQLQLDVGRCQYTVDMVYQLTDESYLQDLVYSAIEETKDYNVFHGYE